MLFSTKATLLKQGIFRDFTDSHSHILYGVDDGVNSLEDSLLILDRYESYGVRTVWLTPHIQEYMPNETEELRQRFRELCDAYSGNIELHLAAEYMIDNLFCDRLEDDDLLFHGTDGDRLLVETSYMNPPLGFENTLYSILSRNITPILAHPERYAYMDDDMYARLHDMGIEFQMNIGSLLGIYGDTARRKAYALHKQHFYTFYGTDIHSPEMLTLFETKGAKKIFL